MPFVYFFSSSTSLLWKIISYISCSDLLLSSFINLPLFSLNGVLIRVFFGYNIFMLCSYLSFISAKCESCPLDDGLSCSYFSLIVMLNYDCNPVLLDFFFSFLDTSGCFCFFAPTSASKKTLVPYDVRFLRLRFFDDI